VPLRVLTPELIEAWVAAGAWQRRRLVDVVLEHAEAQPDKVAVIDGSVRLTYGELARRGRVLAEWMVALGLRPGEVFALQAPSGWPVPAFHLACGLADVVFLPLSDHWRRTEVEHLAALARARALVVPDAGEHDFLAVAREVERKVASIELVATLEGEGDADLPELLSRAPRGMPLPAGDPNTGRLAMITSGSTALPRVSLWSDNNLWFFLSQYRDAVGLRPTDVAAQIAPANTGSTGYVFPVLTPLLNGATSAMLRRWSAGAALELLEREHATLATAIPTQLVKMLQERGRRSLDLRVFTNSGAPLAPEAAAETEQSFDCVVQAVYGASDGGVPVMTRTADPVEKRRTTVGRRLPLTDLRMLDAGLRNVPPGEPGEAFWRNPTKSYGYLNDPERTDEAFWGDGYYRSGDIGVVDPDGYLRIVGRAKDVIIRGGQNISPREVEELIGQHPDVLEVAVIGVPDAVYGERVAACIVPRPGRQPGVGDLARFLAAREVARHKQPELVELFTELPRNAGGKLAKLELKEEVGRRAEEAGQRGTAMDLGGGQR
jgi:acyl-CoA synthetase (AMP-forming)/AMP-acid ligase II